MTQVLNVYQTSTKRKMLSSFISFMLLAIAFIVMAAIRQKSGPGISAALGMAIAFYFMTFPKYSVLADQISFKQVFKKINCPFNAGTFQIVEKKGIAAFLMAFKSSVYVIEFTPNAQKPRKVIIGGMLDKTDIEAMFKQIPESSKIQ